MKVKTVEINIIGIVQGVGFRPFLFNLARNLELKGYILNRGNAGVRLVLQGTPENIDEFLKGIEKNRPNISFIEDVSVKNLNSDLLCDGLEIKNSEEGRGSSLTLPPDIAMCTDCINDMRNIDMTKYYQYPFVACAVCGPRFTTVKSLPYDRERTTMIEFPLCTQGISSCYHEYSDFNNRRFHAQTFACSTCGPNYTLYDKSREIIQRTSIKDIIDYVANRINSGEIAAIKGIGGVHLTCLADDDDVILRLRERKGKRKNKPFALMVPNLRIIEDLLQISDKEREILISFRRPIVLLEKKHYSQNFLISKWIAPGLNNIGVMLPYSGIHHLLFDSIGQKPLVYTSGNPSNVPMSIANDKIFDQLDSLADLFLLHNRPIYQRADDSVLRVHDKKIKLIRRSRGYVPEYLPLPFDVEIPGALATGPELATTGAILRRNRIFPTQHIGNVTQLETYDFLKNALFHMKDLLQIKDSELKFIACDAHPSFITTRFANELAENFNIPLYPIQHHFAHILGLMAENKIQPDEKIIAISTDGVGFGADGNVWGGEIFSCSYCGYNRLGHLEYQPMIGGDRCTKYPARMLASILIKILGIEDAKKVFERINLKNDLEYQDTELKALISQYERANNKFPKEYIPLTSSTGRIFDTVSYLLGASTVKTYRGEPAMRLEGLAARGNPNNVNLKIKSFKVDGIHIINTSDLITDITELVEKSIHNKEDIAAKFITEIGNVFADTSIRIAIEKQINIIGLTGGVAYNYLFSNTIKDRVNNSGLSFIEHDNIPPGDAGISTGQIIGGLFKYIESK